jgi:hypothetical protein
MPDRRFSRRFAQGRARMGDARKSLAVMVAAVYDDGGALRRQGSAKRSKTAHLLRTTGITRPKYSALACSP